MISALLAQELAKEHKVTVLTSQGLGLPREKSEDGVRVVRVPVFFRRQEAVANKLSMLAFIGMGITFGKHLLKEDRYDIISTHFALPSGPVGSALSSFGGIPHVLTVLGGDMYDPSKWVSAHRHRVLRAWVRTLLRGADLVVGDSRDTLENMRRFYTPEIEGVLIPLGIKRIAASSSPLSRYGFGANEVLLVTVGRLVRRKSVTQLIRMMEELENPRVRLLIIGTGPEESLLKSQCRHSNSANRIHFMGRVDELEKFRILQMCDLFVSTSQHEGFGLVFLEAMACGLPIVCYDYGGQTDFLRDGETGYLVPLNDTGLFKRRCESLIDNRELRKTIAEVNKIRAEEFYIDTCALRYENAFRELVEKNAKRSLAHQRHKRL